MLLGLLGSVINKWGLCLIEVKWWVAVKDTVLREIVLFGASYYH